MPCFPIPTAHLFQRTRRVWFKEQATLRGKMGGSKGVAGSIPVTNAPRRQWKKNAAKHRAALTKGFPHETSEAFRVGRGDAVE